MPHLIIEYSANLDARVDMGAVAAAVHAAALDTGLAPLDALRTRTSRRETYVIADRHPDNAFVAVTARLGAGRSDDDKHALVATLMATLDQALGAARDHAMLSVEYQEIDPALRLNANHARPHIARRMAIAPDTSVPDTSASNDPTSHQPGDPHGS